MYYFYTRWKMFLRSTQILYKYVLFFTKCTVPTNPYHCFLCQVRPVWLRLGLPVGVGWVRGCGPTWCCSCHRCCCCSACVFGASLFCIHEYVIEFCGVLSILFFPPAFEQFFLFSQLSETEVFRQLCCCAFS